MALLHQRAEVLHKEGAEQGGDVQTVRVRIRQDAHLAVAQATEIVGVGVEPDGHRDVVHFLRGEHLTGLHLPGVQDLAAQRHDGLKLAIPRLLGTAARGVTLHQEELPLHGVGAAAVGQLAGQGRALGYLLAHHRLGGAHPALGAGDAELRQLFGQLSVAVQIEAEGILHHARHEGRALAGRQSLLGLPCKLRVLHLDGEDVGAAIPDVFRGQLDPAGQEVAELAELAHGVEQPLAQAVDMGATERGGNEVHIGFGEAFAPFRQPAQGPVHRRLLGAERADEGLLRQAGELLDRIDEVILEAVFVAPLQLDAGVLVEELDGEARAEHGLGFEQVLELGDREARRIEVARLWPEAHPGAGVATAAGAGDGQLLHFLAPLEGDVIDLAVPAHRHLDPIGEGVHHGDPHPVQATGELIVLVGELAPRVQLAEDQLHAGDPFLRVDVHRHAATVVDHLEGLILVQDHLQIAGVTRQRLVDAVVDDLLAEVIGPGGVGVHAGAATHRFKAIEDLNGIRIVLSGHGGPCELTFGENLTR